jgi:hypothetical protein
MAVCHGERSGECQSLSMDIISRSGVSLHAVTSRLWGTVHDTRHKDRSHVSACELPLGLPVVSFRVPCPLGSTICMARSMTDWLLLDLGSWT